MKTNQNCTGISTISLLLSIVCLAGLIHVEYKLYTNEQTKHVQTGYDAVKITEKEFHNDLLKEEEEEKVEHGGKQIELQ